MNAIEPYTNIYSSPLAQPQRNNNFDLDPEDEATLKSFLTDLKAGRIKIVKT